MGSKMLNWILIILIFLATTMIIWIIYSINDLARYRECLEYETIPSWCESVE